jgi:hypothetical protein
MIGVVHRSGKNESLSSTAKIILFADTERYFNQLRNVLMA